MYSINHSGFVMSRTRTSTPNKPWSIKAPAFVCPVRESGEFVRRASFAINPWFTAAFRFGKMEGGPPRR